MHSVAVFCNELRNTAERRKTNEEVRVAHDRGRDLRAVYDTPSCAKKHLNVVDWDRFENVTTAEQTLRKPIGDPACGGFAPLRSAAFCKTSTPYENPNKSIRILMQNRGISYSAQDDTRGEAATLMLGFFRRGEYFGKAEMLIARNNTGLSGIQNPNLRRRATKGFGNPAQICISRRAATLMQGFFIM